ncbi:TIGR02302 family protein [Cognatishimia sp. SS12]|uniref:TIGR02302 family protein n=1 Tax=Cognatishimia sp. SS12 TaxID=2979465 RepID=UPI00232E4AA8|nr:TIGR02302 family protein [Cognatishimia sp. SS12]MDC0739066.1 TIGR02302 family protein [Cognatishimia sp. SS12]
MTRKVSQRRPFDRLRLVLAVTQLGLIAERGLRAFWPLWSVVFLAVTLVMMGLHDAASVELVWTAALLFGAAMLWAVWRGLRMFDWPSGDAALLRLDQTLPGRPVRSLQDTPAMGGDDSGSQALWRAHQARMAAKAAEAKPVAPDLVLSRHDPFGLRYVALLGLLIALLFGSVTRVGSLAEMTPGTAPGGPVASWEGWVEPPAYTRLPTLYLNDQPEGALTLPVNSRVILRLYGEVGALTVAETVSGRTDDIPSAAETAQDFSLRQDGMLEIAGPGGRNWTIALTPDTAPEVAEVGLPETSGRGEMSLPFVARDDYEVIAGQATVALDLAAVDRRYGLAAAPEASSAIELPLPMPINGDRDFFEETLIEDFSDHVWAHLPVRVTLQVEDAAGQNSAPYVIQINLPARRFFDPLANALIEQRRDLLWARSNGVRVAQIIRAIAHRPQDGIFRKETDYLRLRTILRSLEAGNAAGLTVETRDQIASELWDLALKLEEGDLSDAMARMQRAQERLAEAMKNGASPEEIARLMQELREATQDYMRQLAQQQRNDQDGAPEQGQQQAENSMQLTQDDLQRMMDRIQELMEQGRMAEAQQALEEFQRMMENMRVTQGGQGQQSPGEQALNELGETLREQQGLSDQAFRQLQEQYNPGAQSGQSSENEGYSGGQGRGEAHEGSGGAQGQGEGDNQNQSGEGQGSAGALSDRQQALRREVERQRGNLPGQGTPEGDAARDALGRAEGAMEGAEQALRDDRLADAIDKQAEAMEALREGMRSLGEALAQNQNPQGQEGQGQERAGLSRDPLGRDPGAQGLTGTDEGLLQGEDIYRRARDLLDEIRRRAGEQARPEQERNYLRRLLDRF